MPQVNYLVAPMEMQSAPRGRPRTFDRDVALETAMHLFWNRGYDATSVADLTAALQINPPSLYAAFGDKRSLFLQSLDRYAAKHACFLPNALQNGRTARQAIDLMLQAAVQAYTLPDCPRGCMVIAASTGILPSHADVVAALATRRAASHALIRARLEQGIADGDLAADAVLQDLADFYAAIIYGLSMSARAGLSPEALQSIAAHAMLAFPPTPRHRSGP
jgi:TetR/AcrR family transcriptional regulator, copper-responsive repressor